MKYKVLLDGEIKQIGFDIIYPMAKRILYGYLSKYTWRSKGDWEDIEQDVMFKVFKVLPKYDVTRNVYFPVWLKVVIYNEARKNVLKYHNKHRCNVPLDEAESASFYIDFDNICATRLALDKLTEEERNIVSLKSQGYDYSEICHLLFGREYLVDAKRPIYRRMLKIKSKIRATLKNNT